LSRRVRDLRRLASIGATERLKLVESDLKHLANASPSMINNKLNSLNILSNAKISTKTIAVIYYLFLKERKLSDVCKICNVGISSVKSFYRLLQ